MRRSINRSTFILVILTLVMASPSGAAAPARLSDFDGDHIADLALFHPVSGTWYEKLSAGGEAAFNYAAPGDTPVPADYDGDGKVDAAIYRPSTGLWAYRASSTGVDTLVTYGGLPTTYANGRIAYSGNPEHALHATLHFINPDGSGRTFAGARMINAAFTRRGHKLFMSYFSTSTSISIQTIDQTGGADSRLVASGTGVSFFSPSPLADDSFLYVTSFPNDDIWIKRANGGGPDTNLSNNAASDGDPAVSPGDARVAFRSNRLASNNDIWVMSIDGTNPVDVSNPSGSIPGADSTPQWSPDGTKIVFNRDNDVWVMDANGANQVNLTNSAATDTSPSFSPDGTKILFSSDQAPSTGPDLWIMPATGGAGTRITTDGTSTVPTWGGIPLDDTPVPADYDGDGKADLAIYRASAGTWYVHRSSTNTDVATTFGGIPGDLPVPADYDGDGKTDLAIFRSGTWYYMPSSGGPYVGVGFGLPGYVPVPGDYDGDGKADLADYQRTTGTWFIHPSTGGADVYVTFGVDKDVPVAADYDGDGKTDLAVFRLSTSSWHIRQSSTSTDTATTWLPPGNSLRSAPLALPPPVSSTFFDWNVI